MSDELIGMIVGLVAALIWPVVVLIFFLKLRVDLCAWLDRPRLIRWGESLTDQWRPEIPRPREKRE